MISDWIKEHFWAPVLKKMLKFYARTIQELCKQKGYYIDRTSVMQIGNVIHVDFLFDECVDKFPALPDKKYWMIDEIDKKLNLSCRIINLKEKGSAEFSKQALKEFTTWAKFLPEVGSHLYWELMQKVDFVDRGEQA